jgi:SAM-dependent methyltransferase
MTDAKPTPWEPSAGATAQDDRRLHAPAVARNRDAILEILRRELPAAGLVLEIASGSGEHIVHFAGALPALTFQPSDPNPDALDSIKAWAAQSDAANVLPPLRIDAAAEDWPASLQSEHTPDAILCINMIHIAPWPAAQGLIRHAGRLLPPGAPLILYGPFRRPGRPLEPSNAAFDASLRARNPEWGLRDLGEVAALSAEAGFDGPEVVEMPANNLSVVFRRRSSAST